MGLSPRICGIRDLKTALFCEQVVKLSISGGKIVRSLHVCKNSLLGVSLHLFRINFGVGGGSCLRMLKEIY
jgi:hypothetical protein